MEAELQKRKEEEEELERIHQAQLEAQRLEEQRLQEEECLRAEYIANQLEGENVKPTNQGGKKVKKVKKAKKKLEAPTSEEPLQLKLGFLNFSDNKSMFENLKHSEPSPEVKQVRVNKLQVNPFLENINNEERKDAKEVPVKVNKLQKNSFIKQLESNATEVQRPAPAKKISTETKKKGQPEIKFESKKHSVESKKDDVVVEPVLLKPKVRGSKSIENPQQSKLDKRHSSTLSLFFDNTKKFFRNSKEKLYKLSKETLHEIDQIKNESNSLKPTTTEMQNYLLSHVLFDKPDVPKNTKKEKQLTKDEEYDLYLDKEYREKIEQYCSLVEESKPRRKKSKPKHENKLPQIKLVEVKSIQEQLFNQVEKTCDKKTLNDELESLGSIRVKERRNVLNTESDPKVSQQTLAAKPRKMNSSIMDKIKSLEKAEEERLKREKENEERIKQLLERELEREQERKLKEEKEFDDIANDITDKDQDEEIKKDIWLRLEEELDNLEEEQKELESTEKMLLEEERVREEEDVSDSDKVESKIEIQEIKDEIHERKKNADQRKKVLQRFQHIFDKNDEYENKIVPKVGSIHDKIETFLQNPESESKKKFEDNVLSGISDVMSKVKNKFENPVEENIALYKPEIRKRLNLTTALKFDSLSTETSDEIVKPKTEKEWAWKSKTALELELENMPIKSNTEKTNKKEQKLAFQDLKYNELMEDINAVKERLKDRNLKQENESKMNEMNRFMDEIKSSLGKIENEDSDSEEDKPKPKAIKKKQPSTPNIQKKSDKSELIRNLKNELLLEKQKHSKSNNSNEINDLDISVNKIKQRIIENISTDDPIKKGKEQVIVGSSLVSKIAEMLVAEEKQDETKLNKAPKVLLRNTSLENEDDQPVKTLEDLKNEQQSRKWAWKEKDMKDLHNFIKSYDDVVPQKIMDQQRNLQDLEEELDIVESLIENKDTNIIVQIREEKEREFNNFMDGVKLYINEKTNTREEDDFKKGMKSYLDLIDQNNKSDEKSYSIPQLRTNTLDRLKTKLFSESPKNSEIPQHPSVSKLSSSLMDAVANPQPNLSLKQQPSPEIQGNQTSLVKSFFESQKNIPSPIIKSKGIHPAILNLKHSKSESGIKSLSSQLKHKLKTIIEVHQYIESHEDLCVPTLIELIHKFTITKKEEEKLAIYKKFLEGAHSFVDQKARSEEQKIFKDNIDAYLKVIENPDEKLNGTPKLKKHANIGARQSTNSKKNQIEKHQEISNAENVEKYKLLSPEEKRKLILQKHGLKDHVRITSISDDSDNSDGDSSDEDVKDLSDNELCLKYGLPAIYIPEEKEKKETSVYGFRNLLSKIRQVSSGKLVESNAIPQTQSLTRNESSEHIPPLGSSARIKDIFEAKQAESYSPSVTRKVKESDLFNKGLNDKLIKKFEEATPSPDLSKRFGNFALQKSSTISNVGSIFENKVQDNSPSHNSPSANEERILSIERSRSFSKFKNAFESGVGLNDDEEVDVAQDFEQRKVKAELSALRSSSKIQSMFRINRSQSDLDKSPRLDRKLDEEVLKDVSRSRSAITNMFESQTPKITFGGNKIKQDIEKTKTKAKKNEQSDDNRKWVFDTIQKYFDVIVEEEQEEEEDEDEIEDIILPDPDIDDDDESEYTSAEEELPDPAPAPVGPRKISVTDKIDISSFFQRGTTPRSPAVVPRSPAVVPKKFVTPCSPKIEPIKRKISINDFVDDAAKQFDELTDGSDLSLDEDKSNVKVISCQNLNQISRSNSSSKIRGLFSSVVHGSANDLSISTFKSNLMQHLTSKKVYGRTGTLNLDPGVGDESSSEYSEYDD